jgi:hypothetical protein
MSCRSQPQPDPNQNCLVCPLTEHTDNFMDCPPWCLALVSQNQARQAMQEAEFQREEAEFRRVAEETARIAEETFQ